MNLALYRLILIVFEIKRIVIFSLSLLVEKLNKRKTPSDSEWGI